MMRRVVRKTDHNVRRFLSLSWTDDNDPLGLHVFYYPNLEMRFQQELVPVFDALSGAGLRYPVLYGRGVGLMAYGGKPYVLRAIAVDPERDSSSTRRVEVKASGVQLDLELTSQCVHPAVCVQRGRIGPDCIAVTETGLVLVSRIFRDGWQNGQITYCTMLGSQADQEEWKNSAVKFARQMTSRIFPTQAVDCSSSSVAEQKGCEQNIREKRLEVI